MKYKNISLINFLILLAIILSIGANFQISTISKLYVSHVGMMFISLLIIPFALVKASKNHIQWSPLALIFIIFLILYAGLGIIFEGNRFIPEYLKFTFNLLIFYVFVLISLNRKIPLEHFMYSIIIGVILSLLLFIDLPSLSEVSIEKRLNPITLGGFNAYGALIANSILCTIFLIKQNKTKKIILAILLLTLPLQFYTLIVTMSRGAALGLVVGLFVYLLMNKNIKTLLAFAILFMISFILMYGAYDNAIASRFLNLDSVHDGSGRLQIWGHLFHKILSSPTSFLIGNGLGSILTEVRGGSTSIQSAHSMLIYWLYSFGILVAGLIYLTLIYTGLRLLKTRKTTYGPILIAIYAQLIVLSALDSQAQSSQLGWLYYFWFAILVSSRTHIRQPINHGNTIDWKNNQAIKQPN